LTLLVATLMSMSAVDEPTSYALDNGLLVRLVPLQGEKRVSLILGVRAGFSRLLRLLRLRAKMEDR